MPYNVTMLETSKWKRVQQYLSRALSYAVNSASGYETLILRQLYLYTKQKKISYTNIITNLNSGRNWLLVSGSGPPSETRQEEANPVPPEEHFSNWSLSITKTLAFLLSHII